MTKFEIIEKIGQGGMGEVYKGRLFNDDAFEKIVAAKKVIGISASQSREILKEAQVLSKLNHPNICSVLDIREEGKDLFILMEFIDGLTLSDILELGIQKGYRFSEEFIWNIAKQVLKGLEHAHGLNDSSSSILHRDLSPHNIMINSQGVAKILDFGMAKVENLEVTRAQKSTYGKIRYCAPEIFNGEEHSIKSDIYALGLILYELCLCVKVFDGLSEVQIISQIQSSELNIDLLTSRSYSDDLRNFIASLAAPNFSNRYLDAGVALNNLGKNTNLSTRDADDIVSLELKKLKSAVIEKTKTIAFPIRKKKISLATNRLTIGLVSFLLLSVVIAYGYYWSAANDHIQIRVISEGKEVVLAPAESSEGHQIVGGETGFNMAPHACLYAATTILSFPSLIFDSDIENKLRKLNMNYTPNSFLTFVSKSFTNQAKFYELLKINCGHNETFKLSASMYEDLGEKVLSASKENFDSFQDLKRYLEPKVLFTEAKWNDLFKATSEYLNPQQLARLEQQLKSVKLFNIKSIAGFSILNLDDQIFPKSAEECRLLLDSYWVNRVFANKESQNYINRFSAILTPFPLGAEIKSYGKRFLEFTDNNQIENSQFKKKGICIYQRIKGGVMESSLRHL